ncbi:unnamed protein product [Symbiodinium microadriaticum]|nr:unnamed protein product [Symbiodinium microadriaticum]
MVFMMDAMRSGLRLGNDGSPRPLTVRQWCLFGSPDKHIKWKVDKARAESTVLVEKAWGLSQAGPDQFEWTDLVVMQHFIMEQLSPITRFCLKKSIFEMDHATPGRIGFLYWSSAWAVVLGCWGFMAYWIIHWTLTNGVGPARAWGLVVGIVVIADTLMNQLTQIYFLNVHMTDKMRPQLREIFGVLNDCLHMRLLKRVGIIAWATLFHPALLNGTYDICQQTVMDLIIPVAWCCFILLNYAVTLVSIYFLIALWIVSVAAMVAFYYWNTSKPAYVGLNSHSAQITSKTTSSTNDKPFRISVTDDMANLYRDSCKEDAYGCSPMAGGSAVVEMAPLSTQDVLLGGDVGDEVFTHHSSSQEIAVPGESDTLL